MSNTASPVRCPGLHCGQEALYLLLPGLRGGVQDAPEIRGAQLPQSRDFPACEYPADPGNKNQRTWYCSFSQDLP